MKNKYTILVRIAARDDRTNVGYFMFYREELHPGHISSRIITDEVFFEGEDEIWTETLICFSTMKEAKIFFKQCKDDYFDKPYRWAVIPVNPTYKIAGYKLPNFYKVFKEKSVCCPFCGNKIENYVCKFCQEKKERQGRIERLIKRVV